jgi:L-ascorbate metabolism protein UlaG (beta-lactamase superfamily)
MNRKVFSICVLLFSLFSTSVAWEQPKTDNSAQGTKGPLTLTFIANEGVMLESGSHKILIDALFDAPNAAYAAPSPEILQKMEAGRPPFGNIDLILITHNQPDHLRIGCLDRFMLKNPEKMLVITK